jgi:hypothetical protein
MSSIGAVGRQLRVGRCLLPEMRAETIITFGRRVLAGHEGAVDSEVGIVDNVRSSIGSFATERLKNVVFRAITDISPLSILDARCQRP